MTKEELAYLDRAAIAAMQALIPKGLHFIHYHGKKETEESFDEGAERAYEIAKAMLKRRSGIISNLKTIHEDLDLR